MLPVFKGTVLYLSDIISWYLKINILIDIAFWERHLDTVIYNL